MRRRWTEGENTSVNIRSEVVLCSNCRWANHKTQICSFVTPLHFPKVKFSFKSSLIFHAPLWTRKGDELQWNRNESADNQCRKSTSRLGNSLIWKQKVTLYWEIAIRHWESLRSMITSVCQIRWWLSYVDHLQITVHVRQVCPRSLLYYGIRSNQAVNLIGIVSSTGSG